MTIDTKSMAQQLQQHTGCTIAKAELHTQRYVTACLRALMRSLAAPADGAHIRISQTQLQNELGDMIVQGQRYYLWQLFQSMPQRVFDIIVTGNNITEKLTMATTRTELAELRAATDITDQQLAGEIYRDYQRELEFGLYDAVPIDISSLEQFCRDNRQRRQSGRCADALAQELDENYRQAQRILLAAQCFDGELRQIIHESEFGRRYYQGPNLQTTSRLVRHAALGDCHEYDIESSVFAWKMSYVQRICHRVNETISMPATLEYLDHKRAIRQRLAATVFDDDSDWCVDIIKQFITALGFGAVQREQGYVTDRGYQVPALNRIIKSRSRLRLALSDTWVNEFVQEQEKMNRIIVGFGEIYGDDAAWRTVPGLTDAAGRLKPRSVVSYLYQHAEREIMDWVSQQCLDREILLRVHDCIYTRRPLNRREVREGLRERGAYYDISHDHHEAWHPGADHREQHRQRIQQEEARVANLRGVTPGAFTTPGLRAPPRSHTQGNDRAYGGSGYDGSGWDGSKKNYDPDLDPAVEDVEEYRRWRETITAQ